MRVVLIGLLPWFILSCGNPTGTPVPKAYEIVYTKDAPVIDGNPSETAWQAAAWTDPFVDIEGYNNPMPGFLTKVKMLWDKHYLYVGAYLEEPDLVATLTEKDAIIYRDNDFEVFIDPDGDGYNYYELEVNALGTVMDLFLEKPYNEGGKAGLDWDLRGLQSAVSLQGTLNDPSQKDTSWTIELRIPWRSFSAEKDPFPENGDVWRINFSRVQWQYGTDSGSYRKKDRKEDNWVWSPQGEVNMHLPGRWGYAEFTGKPDTEKAPGFWIWSGYDELVTDYSWDSTLAQLGGAGITGLLLNAGPEGLRKVIPLAEKYGIEVHAWLWTMNRGDAKPEWLSVNRLGQSLADQEAYVGYYRFMCPAIPGAQDFILSKMEALCEVEGLKGIHMDYIRYVDAILPRGLWEKYGLVQEEVLPEYDYGYHPFMRKAFREKYGYDPTREPGTVNDSLWLEFRLQALNEAVIRFRDFVSSKGLVMSAAVFPTPDLAREMVRQDWQEWDLDCYFPMAYHNFYLRDINWIREVAEEDKHILPDHQHVICGLYLPALQEEGDLKQAINAARQGGADGIAFFDLRSLTPAQLDLIRTVTKR